jgi:hypothetical protein
MRSSFAASARTPPSSAGQRVRCARRRAPKQVISALFSNATGPRRVDRALAQLKKLGY